MLKNRGRERKKKKLRRKEEFVNSKMIKYKKEEE